MNFQKLLKAGREQMIIHNITDKNEREQKSIVPKYSRTIHFQVLSILTKSTFRHGLTDDTNQPVVYSVHKNLFYLNRNIIYKKNALYALYMWENSRTGSEVISNQLTGFQRFIGTGKIFVPENKTSLSLYWISKKPYGRIYLRIPGYKGKREGRLQEYIRNTKDICFRPDTFKYDSKKYIIVPRFFDKFPQV